MPYFHVLVGFGFSVLQFGHLLILIVFMVLLVEFKRFKIEKISLKF